MEPDKCKIDVSLAVELTAGQRRTVEAAFARYADFAGIPVTVGW